MDVPVQLVTTVSQHPVVVRRSAHFHPTIWGDYFLRYDSDLTKADGGDEEEVQRLKEHVTNMLLLSPHKSTKRLDLIDKIQRLGLAYHFHQEIESSLHYVYGAYQECFEEDGLQICNVALRFRLLRQHGYPVSSDVFYKLKDGEDKSFKECITNTLDGILSLYEAAQYRVHGEDILEEAHTFTTAHLKSRLPTLTPALQERTVQALKQPIHKSLTRFVAKSYISIYEKDEGCDQLLLKLAKLDFNILQRMHQRELCGITMWWRSLDFGRRLPFARDRLVECYFWILMVYFEPQYCLERTILTKVTSLLSTIDDIYDVHGTIDELQLFTNALDRLDATVIDSLPEYMQYCYRAVLDVYDEIEKELAKQERLQFGKFVKEEMKKVARAYYTEAGWCHNKYIPTLEEYMKVSLVTCGYPLLSTTSYLFIATEDAFHWVTSEPLMVQASSLISRLMDDMVSHQFEQEREHVASAVECFMNQYGGSKLEDAYDEFEKQVSDAWKDINAECLDPLPVPMPLLLRILNLARVMHLLYNGEDGYTNSSTKTRSFIWSILVDPIIM